MSEETLSKAPDFVIANRYLDALTGAPDGFVTFQFFSDKDKKNSRVATYRHLKRSPVYAFLQKKQKEGCGVYVMVNRGDGKGRKAKNVVEVLALFIDLDGAPMEPAAEMLKPHIIVESSPGRFHLYWLVSDCPLVQFKPLQQAIAKQFNGDKSCVDLCRVLRVPGFYHMKRQPVMSKLFEVNDFPKYTTEQIIEGLGLELTPLEASPIKTPKKRQVEAPAKPECHSYEFTDPKTGEMINLIAWAAKNSCFDIVAALDTQYARGDIKDGKQHIQCPFEDEHTDTSPDLASFITNALPPQYKSFDIHCMHDHCAERDRLDFLKVMLERGWIAADQLVTATPAMTVIEKRRPPKVYCPVNEILTAPEWSTLLPDERRIALDLTVMCWTEDDGCISDNNWMIARRLGLPEETWIIFRGNLNRTGWLIELGGRLTNTIVKREFDAAQKAYMDAIIGGAKGGKVSAARRIAGVPPLEPPLKVGSSKG